MDELFVMCWNDNSENKIEKPIKNYLDLFINTSLNHMSTRSCLLSQAKNKLISNSGCHGFIITISVILHPNPRGKISTNSQINPITSDENKNSKVSTIKLLLDNGASALIICKDILYECHRIVKGKQRINGQLWQGPLILLS